MKATPNSEYMSVSQAAQELGVSPSTVWRWIDAGRLPAERVGPKIIRLRKADVAGAVQTRPEHARAADDPDSWEELRRSIRPITSGEARRFDAALRSADALRARILERRGGKLVPSSTNIIRQERARRSRQL